MRGVGAPLCSGGRHGGQRQQRGAPQPSRQCHTARKCQGKRTFPYQRSIFRWSETLTAGTCSRRVGNRDVAVTQRRAPWGVRAARGTKKWRTSQCSWSRSRCRARPAHRHHTSSRAALSGELNRVVFPQAYNAINAASEDDYIAQDGRCFSKASLLDTDPKVCSVHSSHSSYHEVTIH